MLRKHKFIGLFLLGALLTVTVRAQEAASVSQVRAQIRKMNAVAADASTPPEVRTLNRTLLRERQAQLRELLQRRLDATLKYRADFKDTLTPDLDASIRKTINELIREIHALSAESSGAPARGAHAVTRQAQVQYAPSSAADGDAPPQASEPDALAEGDFDPAQSRAARKSVEIIALPVTTSDKPEINIEVSDPDVVKLEVEVFQNGRSVFDMKGEKAVKINERGTVVRVPLQLEKVAEGENVVKVTGITVNGESVKAAPFTITRGGAVVAKSDEKSSPPQGRIKLEEPKDKWVYRNASSIALKFRVDFDAAKKDEKKIEKVYFTVQNNKMFIAQEKPEVPVKYKTEDGTEKPDITQATARLGEGENLITLIGYTAGHAETETHVTVTCSGSECSGKPVESRIKIDVPQDKWVYRNAPVIALKFHVDLPKEGEKKIDKVSFKVENEKLPVLQTTPTVAVKYNKDKDNEVEEPGTTPATVDIKEGRNTITLIGFAGNERVSEASVSVTCNGDGCNESPLNSTIPSNSTNMRAVVGFEQAGASSSASESKPFIDLFFFGPLHSGKKCKGIQPGHPEGDNCFPTWETWGDVRFSSVPQQVAAFGTLASSFINPLAEGKLNELVQGFNFLAGIDRYLFATDRDFLSPIPGVRHRTAVYFTVGGGAISPLSPRQSAQIFAIPPVGNPQREAFLREFPEAVGDNKENIAFVSPDRDRFLRQYYAGLRFKTYFTDHDGNLINRFPAIFDVTIGQSDAVTGGRLHNLVARLDAFYPFPIKEASFLYFYGSAFMKINGSKLDKTPFILDPALPSVRLTDNNVVITTRPINRDFYRIGIGVNLTDLFNRRPSPPK